MAAWRKLATFKPGAILEEQLITICHGLEHEQHLRELMSATVTDVVSHKKQRISQERLIQTFIKTALGTHPAGCALYLSYLIQANGSRISSLMHGAGA